MDSVRHRLSNLFHGMAVVAIRVTQGEEGREVMGVLHIVGLCVMLALMLLGAVMLLLVFAWLIAQLPFMLRDIRSEFRKNWSRHAR